VKVAILTPHRFEPPAIKSIPTLSNQFSIDLCFVDCVSYLEIDGDIVLGSNFGQEVVLRCWLILWKDKRIRYAQEYPNVYALVCSSHRGCFRYCAVCSPGGDGACRVGELSNTIHELTWSTRP